MTGNLLHAWKAYNYHRVEGTGVPEWVLECFDRVSENLSDILAGPPPGDPSTAIAEALEMLPDGPSVFWTYKNNKQLRYVDAVLTRIEEGDQPTYAIQSVAREQGVSESTVRRAWRAFTVTVSGTP